MELPGPRAHFQAVPAREGALSRPPAALTILVVLLRVNLSLPPCHQRAAECVALLSLPELLLLWGFGC